LLWFALDDRWKFSVIRYEGYGLIGGEGSGGREGKVFILGGGGCNIDEAVGYIRTLRLMLKVFNFKENVKNMHTPPLSLLNDQCSAYNLIYCQITLSFCTNHYMLCAILQYRQHTQYVTEKQH
jgi:hypothetical protein